MVLRYTLRELWNSRRFSMLFVLNLALGLVGFIALDSIKRGMDTQLTESARSLLSADLSISSRRPLTAEEEQILLARLPVGSERQSLLSSYSMIASRERSVLAEVRAVSENYPFYGFIDREQRGRHTSEQPIGLNASPKAWIAPELLRSLGVQIGDKVKIGDLDFLIEDVIRDDSAATLMGNSMAPRIYIGREQLLASGLVQFGSTLRYAQLIKLPPTITPEATDKALSAVLKDASLRIDTYREAGQDNGRMLAYLTDYLGLVSLVALALASVGTSFLVRVHLEKKQSAIATLISLGLTHERAVVLYLSQVLLLGLIAALLATSLSLGLLPLGSQLLAPLTSLSLPEALRWETMVLAIVVGPLGSVLICLPFLLRIRRLNPALLFQEQASDVGSFRRLEILPFLPAVLGFFGLAVWQANSLKVGGLFTLSLSLLVLIFLIVSWGLVNIAARLKRKGSLSTRLAANYLSAYRSHTMSTLVALGLGAALINIIPQIQQSLQRELERPDSSALPSLFLFDIQEDQVDGLRAELEESSLSSRTLSPMIMGRLSSINGRPYERKEETSFGREEEQEQRFRNRGINISFRSTLGASEEIVAGKFFDKPYDPASARPFEISLEQRYAERLGIKLGDKLGFDIQGVPFEGEVTSLRKVKWNSFDPNFFILVQPGPLDDAPKTFLLTLPKLSMERKGEIQNDIVRSFPNVSIVDVTQLVEKLMQLLDQMGFALLLMGWLSVLTGNLVVFTIAQQQAQSRRWDHNLLKVLGADFGLIMRTTLREFLWLSFGAASLGGILGLLVSYGLSLAIFPGVWKPNLILPLSFLGGLVVVCLLTAYGATRKTLQQAPKLNGM